jgi:hypothetical protein
MLLLSCYPIYFHRTAAVKGKASSCGFFFNPTKKIPVRTLDGPAGSSGWLIAGKQGFVPGREPIFTTCSF